MPEPYCKHKRARQRCLVCCPGTAIGQLTYRRIRHALGTAPKRPIEQIIGMSTAEFHRYITGQLTDGMSWENFGSAWNLDYVTSISQRDADGVDPTIDEKLARFHHANARPLPYAECFAKSAREKIALRLAPPPMPMLTDEELAELLAAFDIEL